MDNDPNNPLQPVRPGLDVRPRPAVGQTPDRPSVITPTGQLPPAAPSVSPSVPTPSPQTPHKGTPKLAILLALVIAIILAALTGAAYYYTRQPEPEDDSPTVQPATAEEVDAAIQETDDALELNPNQDFPEADLSGQTLGL